MYIKSLLCFKKFCVGQKIKIGNFNFKILSIGEYYIEAVKVEASFVTIGATNYSRYKINKNSFQFEKIHYQYLKIKGNGFENISRWIIIKYLFEKG